MWITGRGCFGEYMYSITNERTAHCPSNVDSATHGCRMPGVARVARNPCIDRVRPPLPRDCGPAGGGGELETSASCGDVLSQKEETERKRRGRGRAPSLERMNEDEKNFIPPLLPPQR